jgi:hypothetical protein
MLKLLCLLLITSICFQSCSVKQNIDDNPTQTIKSNFSTYPSNVDSPSYFKDFITARDRIFNLPDLTKGAQDSLEIRVWPWQPFNTDMRVFIFKIYDTSYYGAVYYSDNYKLTTEDGKVEVANNNSFDESNFECKELIPLGGWKAFYDSLNNSSVMQLIDQDSIKTIPHHIYLDPSGVTIEFATKKGYRRISYVFHLDEKDSECLTVENFIRFLKEEFDEGYYWPHHID